MKLYKSLFQTAVFIICLALQSVSFAAEEPPGLVSDQDVDFRWAFAALSARDGKNSIQPLTRDTTLLSGDQIKMMVEVQKRCFVYVFHFNPQEGLKLLFPYTFQQFAADYQPNRRYYVPRGDAWFKLDRSPGQEVFYLLASARRLDDIEQLYLCYESAEASAKADAARVVLDRIRALRKEHRELASPAERPVPIGGALRGVEKVEDPLQFDIATLADEIVSTGFVARTFTIEHK